MYILVCITLFSSFIVICPNCVGWYGEIAGHPKFNKDSIVVKIDLERHSKNIGLGVIWVKNLPDYNLYFAVSDTYHQYLKVDSIVFNVYSAASKNILQSTLVEDNQFTVSYNTNHGTVEMNNVYSVDALKSCKEDLLMDFTLYLQTKSNEQRTYSRSRYELKYKKGRGVYFYTAP